MSTPGRIAAYLKQLPTGMAGGKVQVAFATDNPVRARQALGEGQPVGAQR
ncbi:MAG: hypothetical protein M3P84_04460 [Chloroflexota bacterium]|nr:hypothetical protein [Chloroflexota bacterium]